jgi:isopentenyl diphosphate isomerase/L-lactate dehydrogenase-like FMN-dependent dehydrogenase
MNIDKAYPSVPYMEAAAKRNIPGFALDYLTNGLGNGVSVRKNREALEAVELMPRYLSEADQPKIRCRLLGREYNAPFGVAPMGLSGLVWPHAEHILAQAAKDHNIPYTLSTVATAGLEKIRKVGGENAWFQLYTPKEPEVLRDLLRRCEVSGYETLVVTVDVPYKTRRAHDIHNGLSVPPNFDLKSLWQMVTHPGWSLRMLYRGIPQFENLAPYHDSSGNAKESIEKATRFIEDRMGLHITPERMAEIRALWPHTLLVKGVLDPAEAKSYMDLGADGVIVSNHGGRQLDAAPAPADLLPQIRAAVGPDTPLLVDSGVRSGLDIARMLALGADFVMIGRPFLYAVAALNQRGGHHLMEIFKAELQGVMGQLGCNTLEELPSFLVKKGSSATSNGFVAPAHWPSLAPSMVPMPIAATEEKTAA